MIDARLEEIGEQYHKLRKECAEHRMQCVKNKLAFDTILASKINSFYAFKKNLGHETARLMLLAENDEEVNKYDRDYHFHLESYKGKEKIAEAVLEKAQIEKTIRRSLI